jgi:hypothetical protein
MIVVCVEAAATAVRVCVICGEVVVRSWIVVKVIFVLRWHIDNKRDNKRYIRTQNNNKQHTTPL